MTIFFENKEKCPFDCYDKTIINLPYNPELG